MFWIHWLSKTCLHVHILYMFVLEFFIVWMHHHQFYVNTRWLHYYTCNLVVFKINKCLQKVLVVTINNHTQHGHTKLRFPDLTVETHCLLFNYIMVHNCFGDIIFFLLKLISKQILNKFIEKHLYTSLLMLLIKGNYINLLRCNSYKY